jgi:excinuclease UvrABC ATPase subunit
LDELSICLQHQRDNARLLKTLFRLRGLGNIAHIIKLIGATDNNLNDVTLEISLGLLTCITGVSGAGKSTLINRTLYPFCRVICTTAAWKLCWCAKCWAWSKSTKADVVMLDFAVQQENAKMMIYLKLMALVTAQLGMDISVLVG